MQFVTPSMAFEPQREREVCAAAAVVFADLVPAQVALVAQLMAKDFEVIPVVESVLHRPGG
jgi:hypothetical protein